MPTPWPLVGRENQLRTLSAAIGRRDIAGIVVAGAPGLGKTRLASEALSRATARGFATAWAVATQAAASIPFGPLAHLLSDTGGKDAGSLLELLREAERAISRRAAGKPMVLGVDDAHLLDDASAALVHHLATTSTAFVVATVRTGAPTPDAVRALWKDADTEWLELAPLTEPQSAQLVEAALGGQVDGATLHELWRLSLGNTLFLRELIGGGLETGSLRQVDGVWRATGTMASSTRLVEVVEARLGRLEPAVREVAELVAVGEPLSLSLLEATIPAEHLDAIDRAGLLELMPDPRRAWVRLTHPIYGELLRATTPPLRARAIRRRLASALSATGARRRDDLLRLAVWQTEAGVRPEPQLLVKAARQARTRFFDDVLAERLATVAYEAGGGLPAGLICAEARHAQGRPAEAERLLVELEPQAKAEDERARIALLRANNLLRGFGQLDEALKVIADAEAVVAEPRWHEEFAIFRGTVAVVGGRVNDTLDATASVLARPDAHQRLALRALWARAFALAYMGHTSEAVAAIDQMLARVGAAEADPSIDGLLVARSVAQRFEGRLEEAREFALARYQLLVERRADDLRAVCALALGNIALAQGAVQTAARWLRESLPLSRRHIRVFGVHGLAWCLGMLAQAMAHSGDRVAAEETIDELDRVTPANFYVPTADLARAWVAVLDGSVARGQELALEAARHAADRDCYALEAVALHDAARLGGGSVVAARLEQLAKGAEGDLVPAYAAHAAGLIAKDPVKLEQVAERFAATGALLLAAESAAEAADRYRASGASGRALAATARSRALAQHCEGAWTPALALAGEGPGLTQREREVATLAAQGLKNPLIAERLVLSIRTVENHLQRAYAKLGVTSRERLKDVL
ncbi:MAG: LuxR C-terminal-related transcriptional regulator [Egibacteraceae bacterium]